MNLAIDSIVQSQYVEHSLDYTSLQVNGIGKSQIKKEIDFISLSNNYSMINFKRPFAKEYLESFNLMKKLKLFKNVILRNNNLEFVNNFQLKATYKYKNQFLNTLSIPNWAISSKQNDHNIRIVNSPAENLNLYNSKIISYPCDTFLPIESYNLNNFESQDVGLYSVLEFSKPLSENNKDLCNLITTLIKRNLNEINIPNYSQLDFDQLYTYNQLFPKSPEKVVKLSYDDFYPNRMIVEKIKNILIGHGLKVRIIKDDFYNLKYDWDIKYQIRRPIGNLSLFKFYELLSFPGATIKDKFIKLAQLIEFNEKSSNPFSYNLLTKHWLGVPLFVIPSVRIKHSEKNPLHNLIDDDNKEYSFGLEQ